MLARAAARNLARTEGGTPTDDGALGGRSSDGSGGPHARNFRRGIFCFLRGVCGGVSRRFSIRLALQVLANLLGNIGGNRTRVRLFFCDAVARQQVDDRFGLDLELASQFVDAYLIYVVHLILKTGQRSFVRCCCCVSRSASSLRQPRAGLLLSISSIAAAIGQATLGGEIIRPRRRRPRARAPGVPYGRSARLASQRQFPPQPRKNFHPLASQKHFRPGHPRFRWTLQSRCFQKLHRYRRQLRNFRHSRLAQIRSRRSHRRQQLQRWLHPKTLRLPHPRRVRQYFRRLHPRQLRLLRRPRKSDSRPDKSCRPSFRRCPEFP